MGNQESEEQKRIFAENLKYWLEKREKGQRDIVDTFNISPSTVSDWCLGKKFPRIDKIQMLADYLGITKSQLIEKPLEIHTIAAHYDGDGEYTEEELEEIENFKKFVLEKKRKKLEELEKQKKNQ